MKRSNSESPLFGLIFIGVLFFIVASFIFRTFVPIGSGYSTGVREGTLQKYSIKGMIRKTGEGTILLNNATVYTGSGTNPNIFDFSDPNCRNFDSLVGKKVKVYYNQWISTGLQGNTSYLVDSIKLTK